MRRVVLLVALLPLVCFAKSPTPPSYFDYGPIEPGVAVTVPTTRLDGKLHYGRYFVRAWGPVTMSLELNSEKPTALEARITEPLPTRPWPHVPNGVSYPQGIKSPSGPLTTEFSIKEAGLYALEVGPVDSGAGGEMTLVANCAGKCARPEMSPAELLRHPAHGNRIRAFLRQTLESVIPPEAAGKEIRTKWADALAKEAPGLLDRLPIFPPPRVMSRVIPDLPRKARQIPSDVPMTGDLLKLLKMGTASSDTKPPRPIAELPELGYGHFPDLTLPHQVAATSPVLADILTALAVGKSSVTYAGKTITTPSELFAALLATGHTIEQTSDRTYANFIAITLNETPVRWPAWLDSGITLADGTPVITPMGHSQTSWKIWGPDIHARIAFYLGISGVGFFENTDERPAWTGWRAQFRRSSRVSPEKIVPVIDTATQYFTRTRKERDQFAVGLPADGYGLLGVCNDSTAILDLVSFGEVTGYPNLRTKELADKSTYLNGLEETLFPRDSDVPLLAINDEPYRSGALKRLFLMTPYPISQGDRVSAELQETLSKIARELGEKDVPLR